MVSSHQLPKEAFGCGNIAFGAEHELDRIPHRVDGAIQVFLLTADLYVSLVNAKGRAAHLQVRAHPLVDLGRVALHPPEDSDVVHGQPALAQHLLDITIGKLVAAVPSDAEKYDCGLEVAPLERGLMLLHEDDS